VNDDFVNLLDRLVKAGDAPLRTLTLDALIKSKQAGNRPRDREVLLPLQAIKQLKDNRRTDL